MILLRHKKYLEQQEKTEQGLQHEPNTKPRLPLGKLKNKVQ
jgi:hypothetical protein